MWDIKELREPIEESPQLCRMFLASQDLSFLRFLRVNKLKNKQNTANNNPDIIIIGSILATFENAGVIAVAITTKPKFEVNSANCFSWLLLSVIMPFLRQFGFHAGHYITTFYPCQDKVSWDSFSSSFLDLFLK